MCVSVAQLCHGCGLPLPSPGDLHDPGIMPGFPALQVDLYRLSHQGSEVKEEIQMANKDIQMAPEKMINIINYEKSENQNYSEVPFHTGQNGHH